MDYSTFVSLHESQLRASGIPAALWPTLHRKLEEEIFDAGEYMGLFRVEEEEEEEDDEDDDNDKAKGDDESKKVETKDKENDEINEDNPPVVSWRVLVTSPSGLSPSSPSSAVFLVDHAWTYRVDQRGSARVQLRDTPGLLDRLEALMDLPANEDDVSARIDAVLTASWRHNQTYNIGNEDASVEDSLPIWYLMDELGLRVQNSDTPSAATAPFFYSGRGYALTVLWLLGDVACDEEITRDFAVGVDDETKRRLLLLPWRPIDLTEEVSPQPKPVDENFFRSARRNETLPSPSAEPPRLPTNRRIRVYAEYEFVESHLNDSRFEIVHRAEDADVLWFRSHVKDYESLSLDRPDVFINQFPFEHVLTVKDLLAIVSRRKAVDGVVLDPETMKSSPTWIPLTYELQNELDSFVSNFQRREKLGLDNHWIVKPWNLARGMDIYITRSLEQVLKLSRTGPKIVQKYVADPVLFYRRDIDAHVKFDVRYVMLLSSVKPLKLFGYKVFWLRFANRAFSLSEYDDYQKHFTVMNYADPEHLLQMHCEDFVPAFEAQHESYSWSKIEDAIFRSIYELFQAASAKPPPEGIGASAQSRALYAVDLMLEWKRGGADGKQAVDIQPKICEVNFMPDCERACKYHPFFFNEVFTALFLDDIEGLRVQRLMY